MIIGFIGRRGVGKDTTARALQVLMAGSSPNEWMDYVTTGEDYNGDRHPFDLTGAPHIFKFAGGLKAMLSTFLMMQGLDSEITHRMIEGDLKEVPSEYLGGVTPRFAMQTLGTEWGTHFLGPDIWADSTLRVCTAKADYLITDSRFQRECDAILKRGGKLVRIRGFMPLEHWSKQLGIKWKLPLTSDEKVYRLFDSHLKEFIQTMEDKIENSAELLRGLSHASESQMDDIRADLELINTGSVASLIKNAKELQYFIINNRKVSV